MPWPLVYWLVRCSLSRKRTIHQLTTIYWACTCKTWLLPGTSGKPCEERNLWCTRNQADDDRLTRKIRLLKLQVIRSLSLNYRPANSNTHLNKVETMDILKLMCWFSIWKTVVKLPLDLVGQSLKSNSTWVKDTLNNVDDYETVQQQLNEKLDAILKSLDIN
jgi:hypothetical protein